MRFCVVDQPGVMAKITTVLGEEQLSISSIIQHEPDPRASESAVQLVIMTHEAPEGAARKAVERIMRLPVVSGDSVRMRVMEERRSR